MPQSLVQTIYQEKRSIRFSASLIACQIPPCTPVFCLLFARRACSALQYLFVKIRKPTVVGEILEGCVVGLTSVPHAVAAFLKGLSRLQFCPVPIALEFARKNSSNVRGSRVVTARTQSVAWMVGAVEIARLLAEPAMREKVPGNVRDFLLGSF